MAEFCPDCWIKLNKGEKKEDYIVSKYLDLCEGCGEYKQVVVGKHNRLFKKIKKLLEKFI